MNQEKYKKLKDLVQLHIDASGAYQEAMNTVVNPDIDKHLKKLWNDHQEQLKALSSYLQKNGVQPPKQPPHFMGYHIGDFISLREIHHPDQALEAMKKNEQFVNNVYAEAAGWDLDAEAKTIIKSGADTEKGHLAYIEQELGQTV